MSAGCGNDDTAADVPVEEALRTGSSLFVSEGCVNCHGEQGQGVTAPALWQGNVIETFPNCEDQIRWVELGSARWSRDVGTSYGAQPKRLTGGMPGFGERLDDTQIKSLVMFTRIEFGGRSAEETANKCLQ